MSKELWCREYVAQGRHCPLFLDKTEFSLLIRPFNRLRSSRVGDQNDPNGDACYGNHSYRPKSLAKHEDPDKRHKQHAGLAQRGDRAHGAERPRQSSNGSTSRRPRAGSITCTSLRKICSVLMSLPNKNSNDHHAKWPEHAPCNSDNRLFVTDKNVLPGPKEL